MSRKEKSHRTSNVTFLIGLSGKSRCGESTIDHYCSVKFVKGRHNTCDFLLSTLRRLGSSLFPLPRLLSGFPLTCLGAHLSATLRLCGRCKFSCLFLEMVHGPLSFLSTPLHFSRIITLFISFVRVLPHCYEPRVRIWSDERICGNQLPLCRPFTILSAFFSPSPFKRGK